MNIYSSLNRMEVHNVKNALEAAGIDSEIRGEYRRAAMGEIPISEAYVEVWLTDPSDFPEFNRTYAEYFPENAPARATVGTTLMVDGARIEIEAVAYHPL